MNTSRLPVIVGVSDKEPTAIRYALSEARRHRTGLRVVHCYELPAQAAEFYIGTDLLTSMRISGEAVLDEERKVVGALAEARLIQREVAAQSGLGPHIQADAVLWRWLYPQEARAVERAAEEGKLWYSMECVSPEVACVGDNGCGAKVPYLDALQRSGEACSHMRERSAVRRFVDPIFQGGALILGGVKPGWANADVQVVREAAEMLESSKASIPGVTDAEAQGMVEQILAYTYGKSSS